MLSLNKQPTTSAADVANQNPVSMNRNMLGISWAKKQMLKLKV